MLNKIEEKSEGRKSGPKIFKNMATLFVVGDFYLSLVSFRASF